ncbi:MAG: hypothetical protein LBG59_05980 [Candidatus Peribacteria bacterium]|jgi:hypothetical protein|nr:hypothetical protein [Candidatus Peribacteria bacterium]
MPEQLTNSVDTTEQKVSKTKLIPEERSAKIQDTQEKVKQTKEKTDKLAQSDVKEAEELLQEHFGNKTEDWLKKFLNYGQSYAQAFKEKAEKKEFRANTMDTLKLLRTFNKERRNHMEKGDRNKAHEISETFVTQL